MKYRWVQNNIEELESRAQTFSAEVPSLAALLKVEVALPLLKNAERVKE